ncbi:MAG: glycosyltransferase family 9 protein [Deltaproteobacteria bacterium]|jgi:ADP-heptose:LPS heptosyltransferase|nr:glycosyltransferase family 9 protein [Deltaproteobacteria bacterium]
MTTKILLISLKHLGDVVTTTVVIPMLKNRFGNAEIHYLVNPPAVPLVDSHPDVAEVITAPRRAGPSDFLRLVRKLRGARYDFCLDFSEGDRAAFLSFLSGAGTRISYFTGRRYLFRNLAAHRQVPSWKVIKDRAATECHADQARAIGCSEPTAPYASLGVSPEGRAEAEAFLSAHARAGTPYAVCHFTATDRYRFWPEEHCADCVRYLASRLGTVFLAASGKESERAFVDRVIGLAGTGSVSTSGLSLAGMVALISGARGVVGLDSMVAHVAGACGVPVVGIFGPSRERTWAPKGPWVRAARMNLPCRSCVTGGCLEHGRVSRCLKEMDFETYVMPHLEEMLATPPPRKPWPPEEESMRLALTPLPPPVVPA